MSLELRTLTTVEDQQRLEVFLDRHLETSVFLRSNVLAAGLEDRGKPLQATYVAALSDGDIVAVAAHCWNGNVIVQAPDALVDVVREAVQRTGRKVAGIIGPYEQVVAARSALGLEQRPSHDHGCERLYSLNVSDLVVPPPLANGSLCCRAPHESELALLAEWRVAYCVETFGSRDEPALRARASELLARLHRELAHWVLVDRAELVSYSAFNARLPELVQIGGVFTPPRSRSWGYARAVVAGSLLHARQQGVARAILFTQDGNAAAQRAYETLGFRRLGNFGLLVFNA